jgi:hypothetical protein
MTTHKTATAKHIVDAKHHHEPAKGTGFEAPFNAIVDVARMSMQCGIGLAAMAFDQAQTVVFHAIDRGAKIEKGALKDLKHFEHEQVSYMKDYLKKVPGMNDAKAVSIEAHVEEALKTFDVPTRDDIRGLEHKIDALTTAVKARRRT